MDDYSIAIDDPRRKDVRALLEQHLAFARASTPAEYSHALDLCGLLDPSITFFSLRLEGNLLGVGALKELDPEHAEIKLMHTSKDARGQGVGRAMVAQLLAVARRAAIFESASRPARRTHSSPRVGCMPTPVSCTVSRSGSYSETGSNFFMTRLL